MEGSVGTVAGRAARGPSRMLDQFYTRPEIAARCTARAREVIGGADGAHFWLEPSAGKGTFLRLLPEPRLGLDIAPAARGIERADFLHWQPADRSRSIVAIGNPPFGKNASLAIRFFNHAARFSEFIAFIVPRTFEKETTRRKLAQHMALVAEMPLDADGFLFEDETRHVPTVFQVWRRSSELRLETRDALHHPDFDFVRTPGEADFAFQRVGARAGLVSLEGLGKSPQSHYFIRVRTRARDVRAILAAIDWSGIKHRTAGNPSIGKAELVAEYRRAVA